MEGIILGGLILLVLAFASILLGSMPEKERSGRRLDWAEWPLPGETDAAGSPEEKVRRAA